MWIFAHGTKHTIILHMVQNMIRQSTGKKFGWEAVLDLYVVGQPASAASIVALGDFHVSKRSGDDY